jgi:hypothetical protein
MEEYLCLNKNIKQNNNQTSDLELEYEAVKKIQRIWRKYIVKFKQ